MKEGGLLCPFPWGQHPDDLTKCPACVEQMQKDADEEALRYPADDEPAMDPPDREWSEIQQDRVDLYLNEF